MGGGIFTENFFQPLDDATAGNFRNFLCIQLNDSRHFVFPVHGAESFGLI